MPTVTSGSTARHRQAVRRMRDDLRSEILADAFADGVLPGEPELMLSHRASRGVVRAALDLLRREGVVDRIQGTGTLVLGRRFERRLIEVHGVTDPNPSAFGSQVVERRMIPMPPVVAPYLDESPGTACLLLEYIGIAHGEVVGLYTNYVRMPEAAVLEKAPFHGHWYQLLNENGLPIGETDLLIESLVADAALAGRLGISVGHPMLAMQQVIRDDTGRPYDFAVLRHRGDRLALHSEIARPVVTESEA